MKNLQLLQLVLAVAATSCGGQPQPSGEPAKSFDDEHLPDPSAYVEFDAAPELIAMDSPAYPDDAKDRGIEGVVLCRVLVGKDGAPKDVFIIQSVHELIDSAAAEVVWASKWKPALFKQKPVAVWMVIPIEFSLRETSGERSPR